MTLRSSNVFLRLVHYDKKKKKNVYLFVDTHMYIYQHIPFLFLLLHVYSLTIMTNEGLIILYRSVLSLVKYKKYKGLTQSSYKMKIFFLFRFIYNLSKSSRMRARS